jgi:hypothetical protein
LISQHFNFLKMKHYAPATVLKWAVLFSIVTFVFSACQKQMDFPAAKKELPSAAKNTKEQGHLKQAKTFSSDVVRSWINMQLVMLKLPLPAGTGTQGTDRSQGYTGIALYEAVVPGMPSYQTLAGQLNGLPEMPSTEPGKAYHWAASANAALAEISRRLFPSTATANKTDIDNLEASFQAAYANEADAATLERSKAFGKEVATRVANWAATDGSANINPPYALPVKFGNWVLTNPAAPAANPYAFQRRLMVPGSNEGTTLKPPPEFEITPGSDFYKMVKRVYDASKVLTTDQKAMADYFKDNPGYGPGGGFVWVLQEALRVAQPTLDQAALTYAKVGMAQHDVTIVLFTDKYTFLTMRPVTYIRAYIDPTWNTYIPTPNHPEFPSGHAASNGAVMTMISNCFGENFPMTLHVYDYLGYAPRHYNTFTEMSTEMADSRVYGGLHYWETQEKSLMQGQKVAENILNKIKFKKG